MMSWRKSRSDVTGSPEACLALGHSSKVSFRDSCFVLYHLSSRRDGHICNSVQTQSLPPSAAEKILNEQRLKRPSSPHFTIYQPQLTWIGSIANRVTGAGLSVCKNYMLRFCEYSSLIPIPYSTVRLFHRLLGFPGDLRVGERRGTSGYLARIPQDCWQDYPRSTLRLSLLERSQALGLGHDQM